MSRLGNQPCDGFSAKSLRWRVNSRELVGAGSFQMAIDSVQEDIHNSLGAAPPYGGACFVKPQAAEAVSPVYRSIAIRLDRPRYGAAKNRAIVMNNKMMTEDSFLSARVNERRPVNCWLASGIRLEGTILAFDTETIFMKLHSAGDDAAVMMIFKLQIASIAAVAEESAVRLPEGVLARR